jgi:hypothetical protein
MRTPHLAVLSIALLLGASACGKVKAVANASDGGSGGGASTGSDSPLAFLNGFEGEIDAVAKENKPGAAPTNLSVFVKSGKLRFELPEELAKGSPFGQKAYVIFDSPAKKINVVSDAQKQVLVIDLNKSGEALKGLGGGPPHPGMPNGPGEDKGPPTKLTKTGKYDTVAGYKCENWDVTSDHREGTVCVAQEGVSWFSIPMTGIPTEKLWMAELLDGKHFPLRFVGYAKDGTTEESRLEVTKIDKKTLPASEFEYPPTYMVMDLAQLFQGLGGLGGMHGGPHPTPPHPAPMPPHGQH